MMLGGGVVVIKADLLYYEGGEVRKVYELAQKERERGTVRRFWAKKGGEDE